MIQHLVTSLETLHRVSDPIEDISAEPVKNLIQDLYDTLTANKHLNGVALSAIQIGIPARVFVVDWKAKKRKFAAINPEIIQAVGRIKYNEGCMSFPKGYAVRKIRRQHVTLRYMNEEGELVVEDFFADMAVCIQHEMDHLNGRIITDA